LDQFFFEARTTRKFLPQEVSDGTLRELAEMMRWGPTANNSTPARLLFIRSPEAASSAPLGRQPRAHYGRAGDRDRCLRPRLL
jgi:nitroreductase